MHEAGRDRERMRSSTRLIGFVLWRNTIDLSRGPGFSTMLCPGISSARPQLLTSMPVLYRSCNDASRLSSVGRMRRKVRYGVIQHLALACSTRLSLYCHDSLLASSWQGWLRGRLVIARARAIGQYRRALGFCFLAMATRENRSIGFSRSEAVPFLRTPHCDKRYRRPAGSEVVDGCRCSDSAASKSRLSRIQTGWGSGDTYS